ncbi:MAG: flagellar export protein FliJ [Phycisphaerales bacterium]|nr:flagellar export protein FliJ [Phycisphaerales bacterium]
MKAFQFRLQRVLDLRVSREQKARRSLASINRVKMRLEEQIRQAETNRLQASTDLRSGMVGVLSIEMLRVHASIGQQHARRARQLVIELAAIHPQFEEAQKSLAKATSERRGMEFMRDRAHREWLRHCQRVERREESELVHARGEVA